MTWEEVQIGEIVEAYDTQYWQTEVVQKLGPHTVRVIDLSDPVDYTPEFQPGKVVVLKGNPFPHTIYQITRSEKYNRRLNKLLFNLSP